MAPGLRRLALTAHVTCSVGWLGGVAAFLPLAATSLTPQGAQVAGAIALGMERIGWFVLVPLSLGSLLTGLVMSLGTEWGLFRHYWVLAKLLLNVFASGVLLLFMQRVGSASMGGDAPLLHSAVALPLLLLATVLSVYKPRGVTPYGWRKQRDRRTAAMRRQEATGR